MASWRSSRPVRKASGVPVATAARGVFDKAFDCGINFFDTANVYAGGRCEEALRHKRIFKDASGRTPSAVDEEKNLAKAKRMKEIAEEKLENVRRHAPRLGREIMLFKGHIQRLSTFLAADVPTAAAKLDKITDALERYVALQAPGAAVETPMSQPSDQVISEIESPPPPPADTPKES